MGDNLGFGIVIVGAGEAGVAAAHELRANGYDGRLTLLSAEASLPYQRPPLSKEMLVDVDPRDQVIQPEAFYPQNRIDLRLGARVRQIDVFEKSLSIETRGKKERIDYDQLLLATGSRARRFNTRARIHYLRSLEDSAQLYGRLREAGSVAIVGGGVIGLEVGSSARALGKDVTVYEEAPRLMGRSLSPCVSDWLAARHKASGSKIVLGAKVQVTEDRVLIDDAPVEQDLVIAGIGSEARIELAKQAGCEIDGGIAVDDCGQTSISDIYAAGDVASLPLPGRTGRVRLETWRHAQRHGAHVARCMIGEAQEFSELPWFWSDQDGVNIQITGFAADCDRSFWRSDEAKGQHTVLHAKGGCIVAATTINNGRDMRPATKLVQAAWDGDAQCLLDINQPFRGLVDEYLAVPA